MRIRRVIITKQSNIANATELHNHPCVRRLWKLPLGYIMFEFYHPVFEKIYNDDLEKSNAARMEESVRHDTATAITEERKLLGPLYQQFQNPSDALTLLVPSTTAVYHVLGKGKGQLPWPDLVCSKGWELSNRLQVRGTMVSAIPETVSSLEMIIKSWTKSMRDIGAINRVGDISLIGQSFKVIAECSGACGDAAMALFVLLMETRQTTSVQTVQFGPE